MRDVYPADGTILQTFGLEPGQHVLFANAHPDDETVGTGSAIWQLQQAGVVVHGLTATDGTRSTVGDPVLVQGGWRRLEAIRAYWELGVPLSRQHYLGLQDGELATKRETAKLSLAIGQLLAKHTIAAIFTPGENGLDDHPDHQAVHRAALETARRQAGSAVWELSRERSDANLYADPITKLNALRWHATQFPNNAKPPRANREWPAGERASMFILGDIGKDLRPYYSLFAYGERYKLVHPKHTNYDILKETEDKTDETVQYALA